MRIYITVYDYQKADPVATRYLVSLFDLLKTFGVTWHIQYRGRGFNGNQK